MPHEPGHTEGGPYGEASLAEALKGVNFPISRQDLMNQTGDRQVEVEKGKTMPMRDLLQACPHDTYNSPVDVTTCPEIRDKMEAA